MKPQAVADGRDKTFESKLLDWVELKIAEETQALQDLTTRLARERKKLAELRTRQAAGEGAYLGSFAENCRVRIFRVETDIRAKRCTIGEWQNLRARSEVGGLDALGAVAEAWHKWYEEDGKRKNDEEKEGE
jgi:hypothetical protein